LAGIKRGVVSGDIEKRIITGAIVNDQFCSQLCKMAQKHYFKIDYARIIYLWVKLYFKQFKKSPGKEIQNIFAVEQDMMKEADADLVKTFLSDLSQKYAEGDGHINYEYLTEQTRNYFKERSLILLSEKIQGQIAMGRVEQAEEEVRNYNRVAKNISNWFNPFEQSTIGMIFDEDESNQLFAMPGVLGELGGKFERDWLIAFMAPMKRGKSWWLQELAVAAIEARLKVAYFSFEMNKNAVSKRIYKRITSLASNSEEKKYPVMDCARNQDNTCAKSERVCMVGVKSPESSKLPEFKHVQGYHPCVLCREKKDGSYIPVPWYVMLKTKELSAKVVSKKSRDLKMLYGNNLRVMAYPAFSASFDDAENDLEDLESQEGFVPDVLCFDYFDISNPGQGTNNYSERAKADHVWTKGKGLASRRHCLVATVLQSNRKSISKTSLEQEDTAEDIRKLAHVDLLFGLNQTPEEKDHGIMRVSVIAHRHEEFSFKGEVMVLQSLALGQPFLDAEWSRKEREG